VARRYRILLLSDEIYGELEFSGEHQSIARYYPEGTIVSGGLSKWCGAGGWRLGAFAFPEGLARLADNMAAVASETFTSVSAPIQYAAVRAFEGGPEIDDYLARSRAVLDGLLHYGWRALHKAGAEVCEPRGGFYLFPDFEAHRHGSRRRHRRRRGAVRAAAGGHGRRLPARLGLRHAGEQPGVRLALVDFDGAAALAALPESRGLPGRLAAFLERYCEPTVRGIDALCQWLEAITQP
jgi:aspartate aminotransferase